jgi:hypothetical protein
LPIRKAVPLLNFLAARFKEQTGFTCATLQGNAMFIFV